eukprot:GEMP01125662.1.p1 GENE.GEMP01125662.1~~GEMP01125662.1.p1  ORF type:complete len:114 (+),score=20.31 GEMP01125662.1:119-460(+)
MDPDDQEVVTLRIIKRHMCVKVEDPDEPEKPDDDEANTTSRMKRFRFYAIAVPNSVSSRANYGRKSSSSKTGMMLLECANRVPRQRRNLSSVKMTNLNRNLNLILPVLRTNQL